jgi:hypothetical protein
VSAESSLGLVVHITLDGLEEITDLSCEAGDVESALLAGVTTSVAYDILCGVLWSIFKAERDALQFIIIELERFGILVGIQRRIKNADREKEGEERREKKGESLPGV